MSYTSILLPGKGPEGADLKVGLKFEYESYKIVMTAKNRSLLFDEEGNPTALGVAKIIYSGYVNNCLNKDVEIEFELDDFSRVTDLMLQSDGGTDTVKEIMKLWAESNDIQDLIKSVSEKKNQTPPLTSTETLQESNNSPTESLESVPGSSGDTHSES